MQSTPGPISSSPPLPPPPPRVILAEQLHRWLLQEMQLPPSSVPSPSHLLTPLLSSPSLSSLYLFLLTHVQHPGHPSPSSVHLQRERQRRVELELRVRDLHRSLTGLQREDAELARKRLLLQSFISRVQRRGEAQRQWVEQLQSISAKEQPAPDEQQTGEEEETQLLHPLTKAAGYCAKGSPLLRSRVFLREALKQQRKLRTAVRLARPIPPMDPHPLRDLLDEARNDHIVVGAQSLKRSKALKGIMEQTRPLIPSPCAATSLLAVQCSIAATAAILREWESMQTEETDGGNAQQMVERERERVVRAELELTEMREDERRLQEKKRAMQAKWAEYAADLAELRTQRLLPAVEALRAVLEASRGCAFDEWERARPLHFDVEYRTRVAGVAGVDGMEMSVPRSASIIHAVQVPSPGLAQLLQASGVAWFRSADRLLPELCQQLVQRTVAASNLRLQQSRAVEVIEASAALPQLPSLLDRSAMLGREHAEMEERLEGLLKQSTSLSLEVQRVLRKLRWVRASPALDLLGFVVVEGKTPRQWMDVLSALEERVKAEEVRRKKTMEAQVALAEEKRTLREQRRSEPPSEQHPSQRRRRL